MGNNFKANVRTSTHLREKFPDASVSARQIYDQDNDDDGADLRSAPSFVAVLPGAFANHSNQKCILRFSNSGSKRPPEPYRRS
jgi:hypothetical protein